MILKSNYIYFEDGVKEGYLEIKDKKIANYYSSETEINDYIDYTNYILIPGIFDTHNHGTMGYTLFNNSYEDPESELKGYLKGCAASGVANVFPTADFSMFKSIAKIAKQDIDGSKILGIHSEGPYLNRVGEKGVDVPHPEIDMNHVKEMVKEADGLLKLFAIAPEIEGSQEVVDYLTKQGVKVAFAHSNCNYEEAMEAFKGGISVATHTANVMSGIHHRNMGGLGACLLNPKVNCEVICDGMHINPVMLDVMFKVKEESKWMMISDSTPSAGAPEGCYKMGDFEVTINSEGFCLSETGRLMGSTKSVLYGMSVLVKKLKMPLEEVIRMASLNPCNFYGFGDTKGSIKIGKDCDIAVISNDFEVIATYSEGRKVFDKDTDDCIFNQSFFQKYKVS
ncbi:N-acetylglucosamine-6-phosphate deacetylase [Clostridium fungisolvens]|uniref:N-acetylglucosamine-6-phosphate deacetylase n=1 Tax=Clostridium fungisolvens TaxID=1604897 RepID=A0A6V8SI69_9CLOT|nr:N-acetylglucosamine-6-phosphate deacetylase [Clostridium fungisolvens]GFP76436.1 N-acetylglucosamine-6-phosphate deacetylase [Clostridium fungisolvens]